MNWSELDSVLNAIGEKHQSEAESTRFIMYSVFQSQLKKKISPQDVMSFPWETHSVEVDSGVLLNKEDAQSIINRIKNKDGKERL